MKRPALIAALTYAMTTVANAGDTGSQSPFAGWQLGGIVAVSPTYEGSSSHRVRGFPFFAPAGSQSENGLVQFRGVDDVRFRLLNNSGFEAGPLIGWRFGRDEDDGDRLRGLGDVDGGLVGGGYVAYNIGILKPFLSYHHQLTGDDTGGILRFGSEARFDFDRAIRVTATLGATYAGDDYMQHYFSVTPGQSAASLAGFGVYNASAGIKDVYLGLAGSVPLSDLWTLRLGAKYTRLVGDAADSPVVETADQFSASIGLSYRFGSGR
jgi:MipA family protein